MWGEMSTETEIERLEASLNDFDPAVRARALAALLERAQAGEIRLADERPVANMHCHTFFSFNAYGYSPSGLAWLAKRSSYRLAGTVDFDVLDAVDEFLNACDAVGVRGSTGLETRVYLPEFAGDELSSPGEPGVTYHMGIGFTSSHAPAEVQPILKDLSERSEHRNRDMIERLNAYLDPVYLDYNQDVLPLTPSGNATERHMLVAYAQAAEQQVHDPDTFWASKLQMNQDDVARLRQDTPAFYNKVRAKLMKRGGVGYAQPGEGSFPRIEEVHRLIVACDALPCVAWLDGTTSGEQKLDQLLERMIEKGVVAMNIVPDRNWNIADPQLRQKKVHNLYEAVATAQKLHLPLNAGTEMNAYGNKLVDDFDAPELAPVREAFLDGAHFIYGHTALQRGLGIGYQSDWACAYLPTRLQRNAFYTRVGHLLPPGATGKTRLAGLSAEMQPEEILARLAR